MDIEENIWAPKYGLKGQLDGSLLVSLHGNESAPAGMRTMHSYASNQSTRFAHSTGRQLGGKTIGQACQQPHSSAAATSAGAQPSTVAPQHSGNPNQGACGQRGSAAISTAAGGALNSGSRHSCSTTAPACGTGAHGASGGSVGAPGGCSHANSRHADRSACPPDMVSSSQQHQVHDGGGGGGGAGQPAVFRGRLSGSNAPSSSEIGAAANGRVPQSSAATTSHGGPSSSTVSAASAATFDGFGQPKRHQPQGSMLDASGELQVVAPFEFKSGREFVTHSAQVLLYLLLMQDR